uniref:t-SNARE coiled-coil homology domain-containing protein n=3 Tax=Wuchereria bancrofti TaxID=6293 RepID=A0AAF5RU19_WUCBA
MKDRSSEFRQKADQFLTDDYTLISIDAEPNVTFACNSSFFAEIDEIRNVMAKLSDDVASMKLQLRSTLAQTIVDGNEKEKLDECMAGIKHRSGLLRKHLLAMKENVKKTENGKIIGISKRIHQYHIEALLKKLSNLLEIFNTAQLDYRTEVAKRIKRQLDIAGEYVTEDEINTMIDSKSSEIFNRHVRSSQLKSAFDDASLRHNEILNLETNIKELSDLYNDMNFLIHAQGERVDRIDRNVNDAFNYVTAGSQQAQVTVQCRQAMVNKKLYCSIGCIIIVGLILTIFIIYFLIK